MIVRMVEAIAQPNNQVFAGNRARREPSRFRSPHADARPHAAARGCRSQDRCGRGSRTATRAALEAVIINTAGGMTGGDRFDIDVAVGPSARLAVTTAAAEKIYRSLGPDTELAVKLAVAPGGALAWLPQETIVFDRARLRRTIDVDLAPGANLLLAEAVIFGRSAMGETVRLGQFLDRWRVRVGGTLVFAETIRLDGDIEQALAEPAIAARRVAVASVLESAGRRRDCRGGSRLRLISRRGRHIGLERAGAGAAGRRRRCSAAPRSHQRAGRARRRRRCRGCG